MIDNSTETETIGDWASPIAPKHRNPKVYVHAGIRKLITLAGENSRDYGFHEDWPELEPSMENDLDAYKAQIGLHVTQKLALIHEEISEALGEIRSGHAPTKVYYSNKRNETFDEQDYELVDDAFPGGDVRPVLKPEGFGVELADAVIRIADLAYLTGVDLATLILEKHEFNETRPAKHGRKF